MKLKFSLLFILSLGVAMSQAPQVPAQPGTATYPTSSLALFPTYDRASFEAFSGSQAPAFDSNRAPKFWYDLSATDTKTYKVVNAAGQFDTITLNRAEAASLNLPGLPHFAPFIPVPSNIVITSAGQDPTPVGSIIQSTREQAEAMKREIGDPSLIITDAAGPLAQGSPFSYAKIDPSSPVSVFYLGGMNVGQAWSSRNSKGVGYPGVWSKVSSGNFNFVFGNLKDGSGAGAPLPTPVRDLLPNESLQSLPGLIPVPIVVRTDLTSGPSGTSGSGFTDADRLLLQDIRDALKKLGL